MDPVETSGCIENFTIFGGLESALAFNNSFSPIQTAHFKIIGFMDESSILFNIKNKILKVVGGG
jgi:hypothetical protein